MKKIILMMALLAQGAVFAQVSIVPQPVMFEEHKGRMTISKSTIIICQPGLERQAGLLNDYIQSVTGYRLRTAKTGPAVNSIAFMLGKAEPVNGAYILDIKSNRIELTGQDGAGIMYGVQTLIQAMPASGRSLSAQQLHITDYPRFAYRGMHLDVARHFFPVSFVKKYIDYLAFYKFNTFHWHLTDDQGWRIEIKKYPKLTSIGGWRNGTIIGRYPGKGNDSLHYGGYYTQAQVKEIVQYAADRFITVIPEIEMPGHASAAIAAYPQLSCFPDESTAVPKGCTWAGPTTGKQVQQTWGVFEDVFAPTEYTFNFLQDVLDEVMPLFPSKYIHIGGDECPKEAWKRSPFCQQLIKDKGLKDEHGLQSYFIQRIEKYLNGKGRRIIGWDEILEGGLAPDATVMSWRGEEGGIAAAQQGHDVIMTPGSHVYFDHSQSSDEDSVTIGGYTPLEKVYSYEPVPAVLNAEQAKHILGAQANVWAEYIKYPSKVEYTIFPRITALSEVLWSPKDKRDWKNYEKKLPQIFARLDRQKINYSKAYYQPVISVTPSPANDGILLKVKSKKPDGRFYYGQKSNSSFTSFRDSVSATINASGIYNVRMLGEEKKGAGEKWGTRSVPSFDYVFSKDLSFSFNKATGRKITLENPPHRSYPGNGAFTLVDGIQNTMGMSRSAEFLGFLGKDMIATIDLGRDVEVSKVTVHTLDQNGSWIYLPAEVEVSFIPYVDTTVITRHPPIETVHTTVAQQKDPQRIVLTSTSPRTCRYIRVVAKNYGIIPGGNPGAGHEAWLFVDEIEVE
jgi:hexosaminidase